MNLTSTHFPSARNGNLPAFDVEVAFSSLPTEGPIWRTIATDAREFSSKRGRPRELDRFSAGNCTATIDNNGREYDPEYTSSPYYPNVLPEKRLRVLASWAGTQYVVFDGFVDGWPQEWQDKGKDASVQLSATDGFKVLAQAELPSSFYEMVVATDRPDHWWSLGEAAGASIIKDAGFAPTLYDGSASGAPTLGAAGVVAFDGDRTALTLTATQRIAGPFTSPVNGTPFTWAGWFKHPGVGAVDEYLLYLLAPGATDYAYISATTGILNWITVLASPSRVDDNVAHHFAFVQDSFSIGMSMYLDGALVASFGGTSHGALLNGTFYIGGLPGTGQSAAATLAHRQWWFSPLTATQIADHYNAGKNALTGEATGTRVGRVLNYVGWPTEPRDLDTGSSTVGANDLSGGSALDYLQTLFDTEQGQMYMGLDGPLSGKGTFDFVWRQRGALITASRSNTSQATFTDSGTLKYADLELSYDETKVANDARVSRSGGAEQTASNLDSQGKYFKRTYEKSGLLYASDNDSFDHATWAVNRYKDPKTRVEAIVIKPMRSPSNLWPQVLGREIGDRVTVTRQSVSKEVIIEGIEHDYDGEDWTTTFRCSPADLGPYWCLDDTTLSVLDSTTIPSF